MTLSSNNDIIINIEESRSDIKSQINYDEYIETIFEKYSNENVVLNYHNDITYVINTPKNDNNYKNKIQNMGKINILMMMI